MLHLKKGLWTMGIPVVISAWLTVSYSPWLLLAFVLAHFIALCIIPACRHRENLWMFVLVGISTIPINVYLLLLSADAWLITHSYVVLNIMKCMYFYIALLSIEEVVMGILTRLIWRKQYKSVLKSEGR